MADKHKILDDLRTVQNDLYDAKETLLEIKIHFSTAESLRTVCAELITAADKLDSILDSDFWN